jgi:hypothetical protein
MNDTATAPTDEQMQDFRAFAADCLEVPAELASQCISFAPDGNGFKPVFTEPLLSKINQDQQADLQLYFENL